MLKLVVDNTKLLDDIQEPNWTTCRIACANFSHEQNKCVFGKNEDPDDPFVPHDCRGYVDIEEIDRSLPYLPDEEEELEDLITPRILAWAHNNEEDISGGQYPMQPGIEPFRDDVTWYYNEDEQYGCWILSDYERKFMTVDKNPFFSLLPTQPHGASVRLAPMMLWYTNEYGSSDYHVLMGGMIIPLPQELLLGE